MKKAKTNRASQSNGEVSVWEAGAPICNLPKFVPSKSRLKYLIEWHKRMATFHGGSSKSLERELYEYLKLVKIDARSKWVA